MKISRIDIHVYKYDQHYRLRGPEETPGRLPGTDYFFEPHWRQAYSRQIESCLLKITTDSGLSGWGEAQAPLLPGTTGTVVRDLFGPFLLGENPLSREVIYDRLYHMNNVRGHGGGFVVDAMAGIDMALWDIAGKHFGAPVCELLGGPFTGTLKAYVSGLRQPTVEAQLQAALAFKEQGFGGIKLFLGQGLRADTDTVRRVRDHVGADFSLFGDALWRYQVGDALRLGRVLEALGFQWLEAPLAPEDLAGHRELALALDLPIAVGEALRTNYEFLPWLETPRALDVVQPDVLRTGITGACKIAAAAEARRLPVAPHVGMCTGIGIAATWQFAAAIPSFLIQEFQLELTQNANRHLRTPLETKDGRLLVPSLPGLGIEVDEESIRQSTTSHWTVE